MNKSIITLLLLDIIMLVTLSCSEQHTEKKHWSYSGETSPEHWAEIEPDSQCNGKNQSPVKIIQTETKYDSNIKDNLEFLYNAETHIHDVLNNGHTIQFDFEPGDSLRFNNDIYVLKQFHFHEPSEHTIDGIRYPIEVHLVHSNPESNEFAVISILGREGNENDSFEFLESFLPLEAGEKKIIDKPFDLNKMLPVKNMDRFTYNGSLTTPPCIETVHWVILNQPIILSEQEVNRLKGQMPKDNYRNVQALNGRTVKRSFR